jgi:Pin2-interacting protein X1
VKGGYLVGDKIQELVDMEEERVRQLARGFPIKAPDTSESDSSASSRTPAAELQSTKNKKTKKKRKHGVDQDGSTEIPLATQNATTDKGKPDQTATQDVSNQSLSTKLNKPKKKRKQSEEVAEELSAQVPNEEDIQRKSKKKKKKKDKAIAGSNTTPNSASKSNSSSSTPAPEKQSSVTQTVLGGRHAVRSRNIAQKRLAVLDTASLNQVRSRNV